MTATNADDTALLQALFDTLIPADPRRGLPSGALPEVLTYVRERLSRAPKEALAVIDAGLSRLQDVARERAEGGFAALSTSQRTELLTRVEAEQPLFVPLVLWFLYPGYYQQPAVLTALGQPARPLFPEGYVLEGDDAPLLAKLRAR